MSSVDGELIERMTLDQLIDEMLEFGVSLDAVLHIAPSLLPLFNDEVDLFAKALTEAAPKLAARMGLTQVH